MGAPGFGRPEGFKEARRALFLGQSLPRDPVAQGEAPGTTGTGEVGRRPREGLQELLCRWVHVGRELDSQVRYWARRIVGGTQ